MEPQGLTFGLLEKITNGFSEDRKIGQGSYGTVYMGVTENGEQIAVKKLHDFSPQHNDKHFKNEFHNLRLLKHQNIVRCVGYCYETKHEAIEYNGKIVLAERMHRAVCFDYLHNGSLQKHLSDDLHGLDWHTCYKIIKGTCEGLKYLHEGLNEPMYHLDLKPDNILLDISMVPKLADFGLSKIFCGELTRSTGSQYGTIGYRPPEYIESGILSKKFDIFSLGVVILKIITGPSGYEKLYDMSRKDFVDYAQRHWRRKLQCTCSGFVLEAYCLQVKTCTETAVNCLEKDRHKRPGIVDIIDKLNESEYFVGKSKTKGKLGTRRFHFHKNVAGTSQQQFHKNVAEDERIIDSTAFTLMLNTIANSMFSRVVVKLLAHDDNVGQAPTRRHCERCAQRGTLPCDAEAVMASLSQVDGRGERDDRKDVVYGRDEEACSGCAAMAAVDKLLESKVASEGELREAFYVFDRDEDGFVTAAELWTVMRRLGIAEGASYDDCRRMIAAFDGDGDGRISFHEFRAMMENTV